MAENQVSVEGERRRLPGFFFVIATQNPVEFRGTYPLPEAQMDRFALRSYLGYVQPEEEVAILSDQQNSHPLETIKPCCTVDDIEKLKTSVTRIRVSDELKRYIVDLTTATRTAVGVQLGAGPRASLALMKAAQAEALFSGSSFVLPEQIQEMAVSVMAHRITLDPQAGFAGADTRSLVEEVLEKVPVPV
jgi:MoxR-like ATPase